MSDTKPKNQTIDEAVKAAHVFKIEDFYDDDRPDVYRVEMLDHGLSIDLHAKSEKEARTLASKELQTRPDNLFPATLTRPKASEA